MANATNSKPIKIKEWTPYKKLKSPNGFYGLQTHFRIKKPAPQTTLQNSVQVVPKPQQQQLPLQQQQQIQQQHAFQQQQQQQQLSMQQQCAHCSSQLITQPHQGVELPHHLIQAYPQSANTTIAPYKVMASNQDTCYQQSPATPGAAYSHQCSQSSAPHATNAANVNDPYIGSVGDSFFDEVSLPNFCLNSFEKALLHKTQEAEKAMSIEETFQAHYVDPGKTFEHDEMMPYHLPPTTVTYFNLEY